MKFGTNILFDIESTDKNIKLIVKNYPKDINISALDFGKALAQRSMEGYSPNPEEEIDVISGIKDEITTGEDITFIYKNGDIPSTIILGGVLAEKLLKEASIAYPIEIGGINSAEKNNAYIRVAIQKMILTNDSMGSSLEIKIPHSIDIEKYKKNFAYMALALIPEIQGIQFGIGCSVSKKVASNMIPLLNRVEVSLAPHKKRIIPSLANVYSIVFKSISDIILINI